MVRQPVAQVAVARSLDLRIALEIEVDRQDQESAGLENAREFGDCAFKRLDVLQNADAVKRIGFAVCAGQVQAICSAELDLAWALIDMLRGLLDLPLAGRVNIGAEDVTTQTRQGEGEEGDARPDVHNQRALTAGRNRRQAVR